MLLTTTTHDTTYAGLIKVPANTRVVVPYHAADSLAAAAAKAGAAVRTSGLGHYTRNYCGQDLNGKSLCVWRGHGVGDQLVFAGLCAALKAIYPKADIDFYCHPKLLPLWKDVPGLPFTVWPEPIVFSDWLAYDYHLIGEALCEADAEPDQPCHWDALHRFAGLPDSYPPSRLRPLVPVSPADFAAAALWLAQGNQDADPQGGGIRPPPCIPPAGAIGTLSGGTRAADGRRDCRQEKALCASPEGAGDARTASPVVLWQLAASSPIRSYPPEQTRLAIAALAAGLPAGARLVVCGNQIDFKAYAPLPQHPCIRSAESVGIRTVFALALTADLVVCPDSCMGHVAAGAVPWPGGPERRPAVLSLWSSFNPQDRVKHYPNHRPLYNPIDCGPCRAHEVAFPPAGCPKHGGYCKGLAAIAPETIAARALELLADQAALLSHSSHLSHPSHTQNQPSQIPESPEPQ